jgi:3-oxoacyl-[acyl-carrier protein] reductase
MTNSFEGAVVLVTGATRGIGRAVAERFAREGAKLVICARSDSRTLADALARGGSEVLARDLDIAQPDALPDLVRSALERFGRIDIAVANAGIRSRVGLDELGIEEWHRVLDTNLLGTFFTCRAVIGHMRERRSGRIVTISSLAGQVGGTLVDAAYSATKAGIINLTKVLAKDLAPVGVTVNCVSPGTIDTPFIGDYDDELRGQLESLIPLRRLGTADDVAEAVLYYASPGAAWVTGTTLSVSGGQVML